MFIDGDPMFCHIGLLDEKQAEYNGRVRAHDSHFTFGLNVGAADTKVPNAGIQWKKTVQPIAMQYWPFAKEKPKDQYTTVMNWASYAPKEFLGEHYGQKDLEFEKFETLPQRTSQKLVMAMGQGVGSKRPTEKLQKLGWTILEAGDVLPDHSSYHKFLSESKAEWSIAKNGYVKSWSGWFSCRSACYLALGRPVLVQETGWSKYIPAGEGLLAFNTMEESVKGIDEINRNYEKHQKAARAIAEKYFDAKIVCADLLTQAGVV
jgi:hypothetical protein